MPLSRYRPFSWLLVNDPSPEEVAQGVPSNDPNAKTKWGRRAQGAYISQKYLHRLKEYKYKGEDKSIVSGYILTPYWNHLVTLFPKSIAPNTITLLGLSFVVINLISLFWFHASPNSPPPWSSIGREKGFTNNALVEELMKRIPTYDERLLQCAEKPLHISKGGEWDPIFYSPPPDIKSSFSSVSSSASSWTKWIASSFSRSSKQSIPSPPSVSSSAKGSTFWSGWGPSYGCPSFWLYLSWAIGLWLYQSFDAIDGKQARRTGTSGPLGEVFDHGCDALNTTFEVILSAAALNIGFSWWTVAMQVFTLANFYLTTWEEYHTKVLYLSAFSGPVEGILMIIVVYLVTAWKGPGFWDTGILTTVGLKEVAKKLPFYVKDVPLNEVFLVFGGVGLVFNITSSYRNVYNSRRSRNQSPLTPLLHLLPFAAHSCLNILWLSSSPSNILRTPLLIPFMFMWGFQFAQTVGILIIHHVTSRPFPLDGMTTKNLGFWFSLLGCSASWSAKLARYFLESETITDRSFSQPFLNLVANNGGARDLVWIGLFASAAFYAHFVWDVVGTVCAYLDINCLTIKSKQLSQPDNSQKSNVTGTSAPPINVNPSSSASPSFNAIDAAVDDASIGSKTISSDEVPTKGKKKKLFGKKK